MKKTILASLLLATSAQYSLAEDTLRYTHVLNSKAIPVTLTKDTVYGAWRDVGSVIGCSNWSPSVASHGKGVVFQQLATDCKQQQERSAQDYEVNKDAGTKKKIGSEYIVTHEITVNSERDAVGILENWADIAPEYSNWENTSSLYGCTAWTPDPSVYHQTINFSQKSSTCSVNQERSRQEREQEIFTSEIRNLGQPVKESQTIGSQTASRNYSVTLGEWTNDGAAFNCTNWSPSEATVNLGQNFTQTATDCDIKQVRTRLESYVDHSTGKSVPVPRSSESKTITGQSTTRPATGTKENWMAAAPAYTAWVNTNSLYGCTSWTPDPSGYASSASFAQKSTSCKTDQQRDRQEREQESYSAEFRNVGAPVKEAQTLSNQTANRNYTVTLGAWVNDGSAYDCTNWSPAVNTVNAGQSFNQTATDCKLKQTRTRAESYVDHLTGKSQAVTKAAEAKTITGQSSVRAATGTKENWMAAAPAYTAWVNTNALYGCTTWTPDPSGYVSSASFAQKSTSCKTDQQRNRQEREQESYSAEFRNVGAPIKEVQTLSNQTANRNYTVTLGAWVNDGAAYDCTNWSPAVTTVNAGQSFTQTASDCKLKQTRTRAESYIDHISGSSQAVVKAPEAKVLTAQSSTRTATGTKESWVATTPTYTAWVDTNTLYGCTNWTPDPATYSASATFAQKSTTCQTSQQRTKQEREKESYSGEIRNSGQPVKEVQTLSNQTANRNYTVTLGAWVNDGAAYDCTNWSPAVTTANAGQSFTQTASDCKLKQTRTRAESYIDHITGVSQPVSSSPDSKVLSAQKSTRTTVGTKTYCSNPPSFSGSSTTITEELVWNISTSTRKATIYSNQQVVFSDTSASYQSNTKAVGSDGYTYTRDPAINTASSSRSTYYYVCKSVN